MKKKIIILALLLLIPFVSVRAKELTQSDLDAAYASPGVAVEGVTYEPGDGYYFYILSSGEYSLGENLEARFKFVEGESTFDLNGKTLEGDLVVEGATVSISGNGTVVHGLGVYDESIVTVNGGTYNGPLTVNGSKLVVKEATVTPEGADAIYVNDGAELVVEGGTFTSDYSAICAEIYDGLKIKSIVISGGTFNGKFAPLSFTIEEVESIELSGGTYKATGAFNYPDYDKKSAIVAFTEDGAAHQTIFNDILAEGASYSEEITPAIFTSEYYEAVYMDKEEVTVVSAEAEKEMTEEEPAAEEKSENYELTSNGNTVSFVNLAGKNYSFEMIDLLSLTDEELAKANITRAELDEAVAKVKEAIKDQGTLVAAYTITVLEGQEEIHNAEGGFKVKIKATEEMLKYDTIKMIFVDDNFKTEEPITLTKNGDYFEGTLLHLSGYAVVGSNTVSSTDNDSIKEETTNNPKTVDSIESYVTMFGICLVGLISSLIYTKKYYITKNSSE